MNSLYAIQITIASGFLYLIYFFLLRKEKSFHFNRFYLLGSVMLSLVLPFISIQLENDLVQLPRIITEVQTSLQQFSGLEENLQKQTVAVFQQEHGVDWLVYIYIGITSIFLIRFFWQLFSIFKLMLESEKRAGFRSISNPKHQYPFSFFHYILLPKDFKIEENQLVIAHEKVHVRQKHSVDVVFLELMTALCWFNPFIWLIKRAAKQNHEFLADKGASNENTENYLLQLLKVIKQQHKVSISSGFYFNQSKNRIMMLQQQKSSFVKVFSKISMVLGLVSVFFLVSAFSTIENLKEELLAMPVVQENELLNSGVRSLVEQLAPIQKDVKIIKSEGFSNSAIILNEKPTVRTKPFVVLVDAGHGGKDPGHNNEKVVNLQMAKRLQQLSNEHVKILLVREGDSYVDLYDRVALADEVKPDLFLSLHCNAHAHSERQGIEVYYSNMNLKNEVSRDYGTTLLTNLIDNTIIEDGRLRTANFIVLRNNSCPAIMLEMGFLTNSKDKEMLTNETSQQHYAEVVFKSLESM
ncbi:N-acetylmuramoyl-L-alanine amidase [Pustulibacterium marinum]|uniref:N-acetylmuramoyl-L-alanine amidase n=1 Tax=Pustulibacterium marinum TaxID=1224947 RepID=A0A1I7HWI7_9FLAO|nr:M56/M15 family metallopeptidase [Pustulibacterium marinum]SFU65053.1 N-acetylmuramoyl-L-alanine amidase [Pustulibacterium marinum]